VSPFGGSVDVFQVDLLESDTFSVNQEGFPQSEQPLSGSHHASLQHQEVFVDLTVVMESSHGGDSLVSQIERCGGAVRISLSSNSVDLLVYLSPVMVTILTGSGNREADSRRMPGSNTGYLPQTFVSFPGQFLGSPSEGNTIISVTASYSNNIHHLVLGEQILHVDRLFQQRLGECDLVGDFSTVDLDLHDVSFLLLEFEEFGLGVTQNSDNSAVLGHLVEVSLDALLAILVSPLLPGSSVSLLLTSVPVLVEASLALVADMLSEDGLEGAETAGSLDVAHYAHCHHWGCLDDSDGFHNLLFVRSGSNSVDFTEDVSHASFMSHEGSQVTWLGLVVFREGLDFAAVTSTPFPREESKGTVPRCSELTVTHSR